MLDHLIFGVPVLEDGVRQLERRFGVRAQPGGRHQGLGTHNAVFGLARSASTSTGPPPSIRPDQPHPG